MALFLPESLYTIFNSLGWTLLHFLWQGAVIAAFLQAILIFLRNRSSNLRYILMCAALFLMLLAPLATFSVLNQRETYVNVDEKGFVKLLPDLSFENRLDESGQTGNVPNETVTTSPVGLSTYAARVEGVFPWLVTIWLAGVLFFSIRLINDWQYARKLGVEKGRQLSEWQSLVELLSRRLGISQTVQLLESSLVKIPLVVGWLKPVILLPVGAALNLTPQHLESVIAHELAHVRRHDYLVNILQTIAEILLFYHPAVLWVSKQIRIEREYACDDLAIAVCGGDRFRYARALTKVQRMRQAAPALAAAASGGELESRVRRLVDSSYQPTPAGFITTILMCLALFAFSLIGWQAASYGKSPSFPQIENLNSSSESDKDVNAPTVDEIFPGENQAMRKLAVSALGKHSGTVIIMDPNTGRLYTIVNQDLALRKEWSPASTFKLVTSFAALNENQIKADEKIFIEKSTGRKNLVDAIRGSENEYFTQLGSRVGSSKLLAYAHEFGLGEQTGVDIAGETTGYLPQSDYFGSNPGLIGAYGQDAKITPLQLAAMVSAIANKGKVLVPFAGDAEIEEPRVRRTLNISPDSISQVVRGMQSAVENGTGRGSLTKSMRVAGKTGTAKGNADIGLFASFAPIENPQFVIVVALAEPEANGATAAKIAGKIYRVLGNEELSEN